MIPLSLDSACGRSLTTETDLPAEGPVLGIGLAPRGGEFGLIPEAYSGGRTEPKSRRFGAVPVLATRSKRSAIESVGVGGVGAGVGVASASGVSVAVPVGRELLSVGKRGEDRVKCRIARTECALGTEANREGEDRDSRGRRAERTVRTSHRNSIAAVCLSDISVKLFVELKLKLKLFSAVVNAYITAQKRSKTTIRELPFKRLQPLPQYRQLPSSTTSPASSEQSDTAP